MTSYSDLAVESTLVESPQYSAKHDKTVLLKLEYEQPSRSFKSRGLGYLLHHHVAANPGQILHFFCSSGGNAGLAAAVAARTLGQPCTVVVPSSTKPKMKALIEQAGAEVIVHGAFWGEADKHLREVLLPAADAFPGKTAVYCHPYDDPLLWEGYTNFAREIKAQLGGDGASPPDAIVCSVGGGGLYTGLMRGLLRDPFFAGTSVITAETTGANKLAQSLAALPPEKVVLAAPRTVATSLAAFSVADQAFEYACAKPEDTANPTYALEVTDDEALAACVEYADAEGGAVVEPACGAALAVLPKLVPGAKASSGQVLPDGVTRPCARIVVIVCGGSSFDASDIQALKDKQ